jgi:hypothetical protein
MNALISRGLVVLALLSRAPVGRVFILGLVFVTPAHATMVLLSETRSVYVSYYGSGIETHSSGGTFGMFEASAVGIPYGGGGLYVNQKSNITPSEITLEHEAHDKYGPGGYGLSHLEVKFSLAQDTRITIIGYQWWNRYASLSSESLGRFPFDGYYTYTSEPPGPLPWDRPRGLPLTYWTFDHVLGPGVYTLSSSLIPYESQYEGIVLRATSTVPDGGISIALLACPIFGALWIHQRRRQKSPAVRSFRPPP